MKFTYNPRIIKQLGTELITSDSIALSELIKNSFDAKAQKVDIRFLDSIDKLNKSTLMRVLPEVVEQEIRKMNSNFILIEDNGKGMDKARLQKGFFEVGSDIKEEEKQNTSDNEVILGNKGIGRLSAQRLSSILFVETASFNETGILESSFVRIVWNDFVKDKEADAKEWKFSLQETIPYTRLWLVGNKENPIVFDKFITTVVEQDKDLFGNPYGEKRKHLRIEEELLSTLNFLYSPFEPKDKPTDLALSYNEEPVKAEFNKDNLAIAEAIHSFSINKASKKLSLKMTIQPWFIQRVHNNEIGDKLYQDYKKEAEFYKDLQERFIENYNKSLVVEIPLEDYFSQHIKGNVSKKMSAEELEKEISKSIDLLLEISPVEGRIYSFKRDRRMLEMAYQSALANKYISKATKIDDIKTFLEAYNGIKLYRNGFRVATLGNKSSDWLKLQQKRTTGQQFYRFELGNALGYVRINDPKQKYIFETSSREDITDIPHKKILADLLYYIFNERFYQLTRSAVLITKDILNSEGLIPKSTREEISKESENAKELLKSAEKNFKAFSEAFNVIRENKDLDTEDKIDTVKQLLGSVDKLAQALGGSLHNSTQALRTADTILIKAEEHRKRIEVESYNNYKLMANGLVTEVITHELHSLLQDKDTSDYERKIENIRKYLFEQKNPKLYNDNLIPVKQRLVSVSNKLNDLKQFYNFLEKTFVYSGKADDFEVQNLQEFLNSLAIRNQFRLTKYNIKPDFENTDASFVVPKGAFTHVFYNLFDNSIYWIGERQHRAIYDKYYERKQSDKITVRVKDRYTIQYWDSGTGVFDKYQYTLFQPMESGKENGRGMGLYIVRKFLESFDAKIELLNDKNEYGNRYIFEITLNAQIENELANGTIE